MTNLAQGWLQCYFGAHFGALSVVLACEAAAGMINHAFISSFHL
jgi:hypothetical protein